MRSQVARDNPAAVGFGNTATYGEAHAHAVLLRCIERLERALAVGKSRTGIGDLDGCANLLTQRTLMEKALSTLPLSITFLRPAWFMENVSWDIDQAREQGVIYCFLQPIEKAMPMVATADVGRVAAELLLQDWSGKRIVELEGPERISQNEIAAELSNALHRPVRAEAVAREKWGTIFRAQGMRDPIPRIQMLDGFNEGWIKFESDDAALVKGNVTLSEVIQKLVGSA